MPKKRIPLNTDSLNKTFPKVYREFFLNCPIVASASGSFFWSGEHSATYGAPALLQKIPVRVYVGLEPTKAEGLTFGFFKQYLPSARQFKTAAFYESTQTRLSRFINPLLRSRGVRLCALSEFPASTGLNFSGALGAGLSLALAAVFKEQFDFEKIFRRAWKVDAVLEAGTSSGACAFAPLVSSNYPLLFFTEPRRGTVDHHPQARAAADVSRDPHQIDNIRYWGTSLEKLFSLNSPNWPIDFGLIYSGLTRDTQAVVFSTNKKRYMLAEITALTKQDLKGWIKPQNSVVPGFYSPSLENGLNRWWDNVVGAASEISLETLWAFKKVFELGISYSALEDLFVSLNTSQRFLYLLDASSFRLDSICLLTRTFVRRFDPDFDAGTKLTGAGKGGDIVFAVQKHVLTSEIDNLVAYLKEAVDDSVNLDYASWLDGCGNTEAKIEQNLAEKIYSSHVSRGSAVVKILSENGEVCQKTLSLGQLEKQRGQADLILDAVRGEIYIKRQKLTSAELKTASATIETLALLLASPTLSIPSTALPPSSYRTDRNEFQSKIASPLNKVVRANLKNQFRLKVEGKIDSFHIQLSPHHTRILVLEKIV